MTRASTRSTRASTEMTSVSTRASTQTTRASTKASTRSTGASTGMTTASTQTTGASTEMTTASTRASTQTTNPSTRASTEMTRASTEMTGMSNGRAIVRHRGFPVGAGMALAGLLIQAAGRITVTARQRSTAGKAEPAQFFYSWIGVGSLWPWANGAKAAHPVIRRLLRRTCFLEGATHGI